MQIKYQALAKALTQSSYSFYVVYGTDPYLFNDAVLQIKKNWGKAGEYDEKHLHIHATDDWQQLFKEANSYSLFAEHVLIQAIYDKKTLDKAAKERISHYMQQSNERCRIILRATQLNTKQLQAISAYKNILMVYTPPFNDESLKSWIVSQLKQHQIPYAPSVPMLIHHYTKGNMLACAQAIEKIVLFHETNNPLTDDDALLHLSDQSHYQLYELIDACLMAQLEKAIQILRQAQQEQTEPTFILWLLAQECRQLIHLIYQQQSVSFSEACKQLSIWSQRLPLYKAALERLTIDQLHHLLHRLSLLDEQIKSNRHSSIWLAFEQIIMYLCQPQIAI